VTVARQLHASEEVLSRSYGPSNVLRLSFRERKKQQQNEVDKLQNRRHPLVQPPSAHDQQQHKPVTAETAPPTNDITGDNTTVQ